MYQFNCRALALEITLICMHGSIKLLLTNMVLLTYETLIEQFYG